MKIIWKTAFFTGVCLGLWPAPQAFVHGSRLAILSEPLELEFSPPRELAWNFCKLRIFGLRSFCGADVNYDTNAKVRRAMLRAREMLLSEKFVPWSLHPFGKGFEPTAPMSDAMQINKLLVTQTSPDPYRAPRAGMYNESYILSIRDHIIHIQSPSSVGCLHGLQTLTQLFYQHSAGWVYTTLAPVEIRDAPAFRHRGLNLDVARNWFPKQDILRQIDALAFNKMNRLHLHVTDSQSWPLFINAFPELAIQGAHAPGLYYTTEDLDDMLVYAEDRGVQLYLETDLPGHTNSIAYSHPELVVGSEHGEWQQYALEPPSGQLRLNDSEVPKFLHTLLAELIPRVSPYSPYYHTGGDEFNANVYKFEENVGTNDHDVIGRLQSAIVQGLHKQLYAADMIPIVWEEQILEWNVSLAKDTLVQVWRSAAAVKEIIQRGYEVIAGSHDYWYLDCGGGQWVTAIPEHQANAYVRT